MGYWLDKLEKVKAELRIKGTYPLSGHYKQSDGAKVESKHRENPETSEIILSNRIIEKERCLNEHLDRLEKIYPSGLYDWLNVHNRGKYDEINSIEERLNESFLNGGSITKFKAILQKEWDIHVKAIRRFREYVDETWYNEDK